MKFTVHTVATAIEAGTKVLMGAPFGMRRAYAQDVVSTIVVATLDTVVDAVPGLLTAEGRATPAPLTSAEARAWADLHDQTQAGCLTREEAHAADVALILSVSRGDIPDAVRAEKGGGVK